MGLISNGVFIMHEGIPMPIKLTWSNANKADRVLRIYRRDGPIITSDTKGEPIATLPGNTTVYVDQDTILGNEYSYLIGVFLGDDVAYSTPTASVDLMRRGPGGYQVLQGDAALGYMGTVQSDQLPNMPAHLGLTGYDVQYRTYQTWHKFVRRGKILYVLDSPLTNGFASDKIGVNGSWMANNYGLSSGVAYNFDTSGIEHAMLRRTNIVSINGFNFHSRTARAFPDDWTGDYSQLSLTLRPDTEFNEIIQPMIPGLVFANAVGSRSPSKDTVIFRDFIAAESRGPSPKNHIVKPIVQISSNRVPNWVDPCVSRNYTWDTYKEVSGQSNQHCFYIPVLELIED